jgi:hypothetical protein
VVEENWSSYRPRADGNGTSQMDKTDRALMMQEAVAECGVIGAAD